MAIKHTQLNKFQSYGTYTTYIPIKQTSDAFLVVDSMYRFSYFFTYQRVLQIRHNLLLDLSRTYF